MKWILPLSKGVLFLLTSSATKSLAQCAARLLTLSFAFGYRIRQVSAASATRGQHPWYREFWFIELCISISVLLVMIVLQLEIVKAKDREMTRVIEEKTADLKKTNETLSRLTFVDSLTNLANRRAFDEVLDKEIARMIRGKTTLSLVIFDVDDFKMLNDSQGHQKGDECLMRLAAEIKRSARRPADLAARIGGEEFALILPDSTDAWQVAESTRMAIVDLKLPNPASPTSPFITISAGVVTTYVESAKSLIAAADRALYNAKRAGKNCVVVDAIDSDVSDTQESEQTASR